MGAFRKANNQCTMCGTESGTLEVDHIVPMAFGGDVVASSNLQVLCVSCHQSKSLADVAKYENRKQSHIKLWKFLYSHGRAIDPTCRYCGKEFVRKYRSITVYCSEECKYQCTKSKTANKLMYQKRRNKMIKYVNRRRREHPEVREYQRRHAQAKRRGWKKPKQSEFTFDKESGKVIYTPEKVGDVSTGKDNGTGENQSAV